MALVRCAKKHSPPNGRTQDYRLGVAPVGDGLALLCGLIGCGEPGLIWLNAEESRAYERGQRDFGMVNGAHVKFHASDTVKMRG